VGVDDVADDSEANAASLFRLELYRVDEFLCMCVYIVKWMVKAVSSTCRAEPSRAGPRRAGCCTALR
jgi:hypothetical protein